MLQSIKYNSGFKGMKIPGAGLDGLLRVPSYILTNPKFSNFSEDVNTTNQAAISSHSTTALVLPLHQLSIGQKQSDVRSTGMCLGLRSRDTGKGPW